MTFDYENHNEIINNIKELLLIGAKDRKHAFHTPIFSNNNGNYSTSSRVVVLREFNQEKMTLNFNTDYRSPKIIELKKNSKSNFVFYDAKIKIQLRIKTVTNIHYDDNTASEAWKQTRLFSRKCYLTKKAPSSATMLAEDGIPEHLKGIDPTKDESEIGYKNFTVLENLIQEIDWLYLASSGHRRLKISLNNKPKFEWIIP